jgi:hypothetical protein
MIPRIKTLTPLSNYRLYIEFDDGKKVIYDVKEDMTLPHYGELRTVYGLFNNVQIDSSRSGIYWTDYIDLPSDTLYEYGHEV